MHGNELARAARLEAAGHQEHVAAGKDPLSQRRVKGQKDGRLPRVLLHHLAEQLVVVLVSRPHQHKLHAQIQYMVDRLTQNIESLRVGQPRDDADQGYVRILGKLGLPLQGQFVLPAFV